MPNTQLVKRTASPQRKHRPRMTVLKIQWRVSSNLMWLGRSLSEAKYNDSYEDNEQPRKMVYCGEKKYTV